MGDDHQQDSLEEEILLAISEPHALRPYLDAAGFDGWQELDNVLRDAAAGEIPRGKSHDPGEDQRGDVVSGFQIGHAVLTAEDLSLEGVPQAPVLRRRSVYSIS